MSAGRVRRVQGWWKSALSLAVLSYALVFAASPLLHHDLSCELKSRTHCTSCISGISAPGLTSNADLPALEMPMAGAIALAAHSPAARSFRDSVLGRAPPAA